MIATRIAIIRNIVDVGKLVGGRQSLLINIRLFTGSKSTDWCPCLIGPKSLSYHFTKPANCEYQTAAHSPEFSGIFCMGLLAYLAGQLLIFFRIYRPADYE